MSLTILIISENYTKVNKCNRTSLVTVGMSW